MRHPKLVSLALMIAVFGCVGGIAWAVMNSHAHIEIPMNQQRRDAPTFTDGNVSLPNVVAWKGYWKSEAPSVTYGLAF
jgi:hypothetical protein